MGAPVIPCRDCFMDYDPQAPRCPTCGTPTVINRMWVNQGGKKPGVGISFRGWSWGLASAITLWLIFAAAIIYATG